MPIVTQLDITAEAQPVTHIQLQTGGLEESGRGWQPSSDAAAVGNHHMEAEFFSILAG